MSSGPEPTSKESQSKESYPVAPCHARGSPSVPMWLPKGSQLVCTFSTSVAVMCSLCQVINGNPDHNRHAYIHAHTRSVKPAPHSIRKLYRRSCRSTRRRAGLDADEDKVQRAIRAADRRQPKVAFSPAPGTLQSLSPHISVIISVIVTAYELIDRHSTGSRQYWLL